MDFFGLRIKIMVLLQILRGLLLLKNRCGGEENIGILELKEGGHILIILRLVIGCLKSFY